MKKITSLIILTLIPIFTFAFNLPQAEEVMESYEPSHAYFFVIDDCSHCNDLKEFINENELSSDSFSIEYIDIKTQEGAVLFNEITTKLKTGKVTPIGLVLGDVYVGFDKDVVGDVLIESSNSENLKEYGISEYLDGAEVNSEGETCDEQGEAPCLIDAEEEKLKIPVLGDINPQKTSLILIASSLGFVDGFNPCAMWVLLTFLLILSQVGDRKKMIQVAGLFIFAEAIMYYFILNVWYQTWDFIALDGIVTPLVGLLALGSGMHFVRKYIKSRGKPLTCDVTNIEHQRKTENRIQKLISKKMSFSVAIAIILLALSVNVIEFACSVGIPQAFTKILELNSLNFFEYQFYTLIYTFFYMMDDFIVFGLAIWGYQRFYSVGQKYSRISTLVAGILMLILGLLLVFNPDALTW